MIDVDLLVTAPAGTSLFILNAFRADVEELVGFPVDVIDDGLIESHCFARSLVAAVML